MNCQMFQLITPRKEHVREVRVEIYIIRRLLARGNMIATF